MHSSKLLFLFVFLYARHFFFNPREILFWFMTKEKQKFQRKERTRNPHKQKNETENKYEVHRHFPPLLKVGYINQRCHNILWWIVALFEFQFLTTVIAWPILLLSSLMLLTTGLYILSVQPSWVFMAFITHAQNNWGKSLPSFHSIATFLFNTSIPKCIMSCVPIHPL